MFWPKAVTNSTFFSALINKFTRSLLLMKKTWFAGAGFPHLNLGP